MIRRRLLLKYRALVLDVVKITFGAAFAFVCLLGAAFLFAAAVRRVVQFVVWG